ncbi:MAG TPA: hypothetical protein VIY47_06785, partial [Ignavibacteriaceae bacterium]
MKAVLFSLIAIFFLSFTSQSQLKGLMKKVQNKVEQKVDQRVDKKVDNQIDKTLDELEGKNTAKTETSVPSPATQPPNSGIKSYSKYDFVPGEKIIYSNDFSTDNMGELPIGWNTNG